MRTRLLSMLPSFVVGCVLPVALHAVTAPPAIDSLGRFPSVEGRTLEGADVRLPTDLAGELNVVLVAFAREQQRDVDSWTPFLRRVAGAHDRVRVYELPTLARRYGMVRPFIDGGMRRGIPDRAVRASTITLYIDKAPFRRALRLPDEDRIYVLLVDRAGVVRWRAAGPFSADRASELEALLTRSAPD